MGTPDCEDYGRRQGNKPTMSTWDIFSLFYFTVMPIFLSIKVNVYPKYERFKLLKNYKDGRKVAYNLISQRY